MFKTCISRGSGLHVYYVSAILIFAISPAMSRASTVVDLRAIETADKLNDNRLRAYDRIYGTHESYIKFDLSVIPDTAIITDMTLTLYAEGAYSAPYNSPHIQIRRSSFDSWTRGVGNLPATYDEILSAVDIGPFPSTRHTPYSFVIDTHAFSWNDDLLDDRLSLVLDEVSPTNNDYMYFFGSHPVSVTGDANSAGTVTDYIPRLSVAYIPEPASVVLLTAGGFLLLRRTGSITC